MFYGGSGVTEAWYGGVKVWPTSIDYSSMYLTFDVLTGGTIVWTQSGGSVNKEIQYSINNGAWNSIYSLPASSFDVSRGDKVRFRGVNDTYSTGRDYWASFSGSTAYVNVYGNIMSLIYGDNFIGQTALTGTNTFNSLFSRTYSVNADNLVLPALTPKERMYRQLFSYCTVLESAKFNLPIMNLGEALAIYGAMFYHSSAIKEGPELPATVLSQSCYSDMFAMCVSLEKAPELPAETLVTSCYSALFSGCTKINYIKCLAHPFNTSYQTSWVRGVASTGTFVKSPSLTSYTRGNNGIPTNWIVEDDSHISLSSYGEIFAASGETKTITVTSDAPWTATTNDSYVSISPNTGVSGVTNMNITASSNTGSSRNFTVLFSINNTEFSGTQQAAEPVSVSAFTYTSTDGNIVTPNKNTWGSSNIISNTYSGGIGTIVFDSQPTTIPDNTFSGCTTLSAISMSNNITSIGTDVFKECTALTDVTLSNSVTALQARTFSGCTSLETLTIPSSVTSIGYKCFAECKTLGKLHILRIPNSVTSIGMNCFHGCSEMQYITLSNSITGIPDYCFYGCFKLLTLTIPSGVTSLGKEVFNWCVQLKTIYSYPTIAPTIRSDTFYNLQPQGTKTLHYPSGSDYSSWLSSSSYYLGYYNWTGVNDL